ncbi:hypothetical protein WA1_15720 [Scytonema hofmannii PCC 7110]|uniref:Uncharacterized protein n=1 Tax=Scytonema hofmannii PCC 7110 TaxID=128403 RepID=A0A139XA33_9CYAN|nr:hypothetical protein WA1_15720 [Scytonema hofmannii PCC 7110]
MNQKGDFTTKILKKAEFAENDLALLLQNLLLSYFIFTLFNHYPAQLVQHGGNQANIHSDLKI